MVRLRCEGEHRDDGGQTLEFVFAYVYGRWRIDNPGGEVVDHCGSILNDLIERDYPVVCCTKLQSLAITN